MNMKKLMIIAVIMSGCTFGNVDDVKSHANETWSQLGFTVVGYEGYQWGINPWPKYGGAHVWYTLTRENTNGKVTYTGALQRWGDEYHNTRLRAVDAIKGN
jgi:hypothetical protein